MRQNLSTGFEGSSVYTASIEDSILCEFLSFL